jgi:hypothetical protein
MSKKNIEILLKQFFFGFLLKIKSFQEDHILGTKGCIFYHHRCIHKKKLEICPKNELFGPIQGRWLRHHVKKNHLNLDFYARHG